MRNRLKMSNQNKNIIYALSLVAVVLMVYFFRKGQNLTTNTNIHIAGKTFGVVAYHIKYIDPTGRNLQPAIDSVLDNINQSLSTYLPESEISLFNSKDSLIYQSSHFYPMLVNSKIVFEKTNGAFDPTIMPLVKAWGFGPNKSRAREMRAVNVDSLLKYVGFDRVVFDEEKVKKNTPKLALDFSAIAKGYAVDVVATLLESYDIQNFMIEIGGEILCKGKNLKGEFWAIGIDNPTYDPASGNAAIALAIALKNSAIATSGSYRNFYERAGKRYIHIIDPKTGMPLEQQLLSASVIMSSCTLADAYATAFMVMGTQKSKKFALANGIATILIYDEEGIIKTYISPELHIL